ncbi:zinc finger CCCH domain-containing protein 10-like [Amphibalanus amphitrite]|uniref:zinc finger CCCH domain-containing protein 10-like n=1 Tax=Amphibalanus amphitrite TaxID=1232801 RepID=UPI001C901FBC|nr:zinc finger CCCH domain-containing protein 10-like [Amphibalanus amphitrite]
MDAASDASSGADSAVDDQLVCRDFLRNVCRRGRRCKFPHPEEEVVAPPPARPELVTFCHDYQNGQCARPSCRFVHCERGDEELFRRTGHLPSHVLEAAVMRGADIRVGRHEVPVCKDFARGECSRGVKCKYRHLTVSELEQLCSGGSVSSSGSRPASSGSPDSGDCEPPEAKRRHFDDYSRRGVVVRDYRQTPLSQEPNPHSIIDYRLIEDENRILQRRVQELQKQVDDLTTTNEFLLDQNAQMRLAKQSASGAGVTTLATVSVPAVSMAAGSGGVAAAPITMCPISQPLVAQGAAAQVVTVPGSMGAVPVTLTHTPGTAGTISVSLAPVTLNQQGAAVVSMASMAANINHQAAVASMNNMNQLAVTMPSLNQPVAASMTSIANMNQAAVATMNSMNPLAVSLASMNQPVAASMASMANMTQAAAATMASMNPMAAATMAANQSVFQPAASINQPAAASMASMASINEAAVATMASMNSMAAAATMASMPQPVAASMAASMNPMAAASMASINQPMPVASMASINSANVAGAVLR